MNQLLAFAWVLNSRNSVFKRKKSDLNCEA